jgi:Major Facilitator Superfamily
VKKQAFLLIRKPAFGAYLLVEFLAIAGSWNVAVSQSSAMRHLGGSTQDLGRLAAFSLLPLEVLVGIFVAAGVLADRFRATTILATTSAIACAMTLFVAVRFQMGSGSRAVLFAEALVTGVLYRASLPARFTLIRSTLDVGDQTAAVALVNATQSAGRFVGLLSMSAFELKTNSRFFVGSIALLPLPLVLWLLLHKRTEVRGSEATGRFSRRGVGDVFEYLSQLRLAVLPLINAGVLGVVLTVRSSVIYEILKEHGRRVRNVNSLGLLETFAGAAAAVWIAKRGHEPTRLGLAAGLMVLGIGCIGAAIGSSILGLQLTMVVIGAVTSFLVITNLGLLQLKTGPQFLGRIMALYGIATAVGVQLGVLLVTSYSLDAPTALMLFCGAISAVLGVLLWRFEKLAAKAS